MKSQGMGGWHPRGSLQPTIHLGWFAEEQSHPAEILPGHHFHGKASPSGALKAMGDTSEASEKQNISLSVRDEKKEKGCTAVEMPPGDYRFIYLGR